MAVDRLAAATARRSPESDAPAPSLADISIGPFPESDSEREEKEEERGATGGARKKSKLSFFEFISFLYMFFPL